MNKVKTYVKDWKKEKVKELTKLVKKYSIIGLLNLKGLPSSQFQTIRSKLRGDILIKTAKKSFIERALSKAGYEELSDYIEGSPALLLTNLSPFKVHKLIQENKSKTVIKPGQKAPFDLIIEKGETPFQPGPIIGEFGELGVKAKIMKGKIHVIKSAVVVPEGEEASELAAGMLARLEVKPMEIGLDLVIIRDDDGILYESSVLDVKIKEKIATAYTHAKNLVLNTGLFVPSLIKEILQKAQFQALLLNGVVNPEQAIKQEALEKEKEAPDEEEEEEEEVSEEEAAEGLGALFG